MKHIIRIFLLFILFAAFINPGICLEMSDVQIQAGGKDIKVVPSAVFDGSHVYAPISILNLLNVNYTADPNQKSITMSNSFNKFQNIDTVLVNGTRMIDITSVFKFLDVKTKWNDDKKILHIYSNLTSVEFDSALLTVKINGTLSTSHKVVVLPGKIIIDVADTVLATAAREVSVESGLVTACRIGQYNDETARVVLDLSKPAGYADETSVSSSQIQIRVGENLPKFSVVKAVPAIGLPSKSFKINSVSIETVDDLNFNIVASTDQRGVAKTEIYYKKSEMLINIPGGEIADGVEIQGSHSLIKSARFIEESSSRTVIKLELNRVMKSIVKTDNDSITVSITPLDKSGGSISGKLIVIDPGHGGKDTGAKFEDVLEKDLNLKIASVLANMLVEQGARVNFTRSDDSYISLAGRSETAINNNADFFVSIHCNSNTRPGSASGIETYYHMDRLSSKVFACQIHNGVLKCTGMTDRSPRSDSSLYSKGLAVLRHLDGSGIPGVLVECGYMNHSFDRASLSDVSYHKKVAAGIIAGIKAYIAGSPLK